MKDILPYGKHFLDDEDVEKVVKVLKNGWLTQGPAVASFEEKFSSYVGAKYAVAVSSGTAALHLAILSLNLPSGSSGFTSVNTFVATPNSMLYSNIEPKFVDISPETLNMCPVSLEEAVAGNDQCDLIVPVHFAGAPCEMEKISKIAAKLNSHVVEDASHALGATYACGAMVGSCKYSSLTTFSLHPVKGVTSGEGGVITTNDRNLYDLLLKLRSHGIHKGNFDLPHVSKVDEKLLNLDLALDDGKLNPWYYEMQHLGFNYRITDFQCALAESQLEKLGRFLDFRKKLVDVYDKQFSTEENIRLTQKNLRERSSFHIYVVEIDFEAIDMTRLQFMSDLKDKGIGTQVHYIPICYQPYYQKRNVNSADFPNAIKYYDSAISIPLYYGLTSESQSLVIESILGLTGRS